MNIEEVAEESPGDIVSITIDVNKGMTQAQAEEMARRIHFTGDKVQKAARNMLALYDLFIKKDATQVSSMYIRFEMKKITVTYISHELSGRNQSDGNC